jgi:dephospho-CoA kinase
MPLDNRPLLIGVTGNIGSGKSAFCRLLQTFGLVVISADEVANNCLQMPEVCDALQSRYSESILDDNSLKGHRQINRKKLADKVFGLPVETAYLNSLIHPLVLKEFDRLAQTSSEAYLVFEVPLLFEAKLQACFDLLVLVYTPLDIRLERLEARGETYEDVLKRQSHQIPDEAKLDKVDQVIYNHLDGNSLREEARLFVQSLHEQRRKHTRLFVSSR